MDQANAPAPTRAVMNAARPVGELQPEAAATTEAVRVAPPAAKVTDGTGSLGPSSPLVFRFGSAPVGVR